MPEANDPAAGKDAPVNSGVSEARARMDRLRESGLKRPSRIVFGPGAAENWGAILSDIGSAGPALVVCGRHNAADARFMDRLRGQMGGANARTFHVVAHDGEPTVDSVETLTRMAREFRPEVLVAIGGGSVMDAGKAVAAMAVHEGSVEDYLEGPQGARPLTTDPLPMMAVPTTAGTGSEMTRNAVVLSRRQGCKRSLRDNRLFPAIALIDPALCRGAPRAVTLASGLDAVTQLMESAITIRRTSETTAMALVGLRGISAALDACVGPGESMDARALMSAAASISGACLANSGLGLAHGVAAALGARLGLGHGWACGMLLPHVMRWNLPACRDEMTRALGALFSLDSPVLPEPEALLDRLDRWASGLGVPPDLRHLQLSDADLDALAELSLGSSLLGNPVPMDAGDVRRFLISVAR